MYSLEPTATRLPSGLKATGRIPTPTDPNPTAALSACHSPKTAISLPAVGSHNRLVPAPPPHAYEAIRLPSDLYATRMSRSNFGGPTSALRRIVCRPAAGSQRRMV